MISKKSVKILIDFFRLIVDLTLKLTLINIFL